MLWGIRYSPFDLIDSLIFRQNGLLGIITKATSQLLLGFLVFSGVMLATGAGKFFMDIATALLGRYRGGPAKVSAVASGLFGSLSGSVYENIIGTVKFTIPAMKKIGYPSYYAAAIETVASTGGMLMPPVMGSVAFLMAMILGVEYRTIIIAAVLPSLLYYSGVLFQIDAYAAKVGIKGLPNEEIPSFVKVIRDGWLYLFVLFFLIFGLLYMRWESMAPWYASGIMILISFCKRSTR